MKREPTRHGHGGHQDGTPAAPHPRRAHESHSPRAITRHLLCCPNCSSPLTLPPAEHPRSPALCPNCQSQFVLPLLAPPDASGPLPLPAALARNTQAIAQLQNQLDESHKTLHLAERRGGDRHSLITQQQDQINRLNVERAELRGEVERLRRELRDATAGLLPEPPPPPQQAPAPDHHEMRERIASMETELDATRQTLLNTEEERDALHAHMIALAAERDEILQRAGQLEQELHRQLAASSTDDATQARLDIETLRAELAKTRLELLSTQERAATSEANALRATQELERARHEVERARQELKHNDGEYDRLADSLQELQRHYAVVNRRLEEARAQIDALKPHDRPAGAQPAPAPVETHLELKPQRVVAHLTPTPKPPEGAAAVTRLRRLFGRKEGQR